mmetsp:Transcript_15200/g.61080  ORF Transcript_15200/g.61080 Transcript_15200/m.61080 type:complete len:326 (+) Transcript_15200:1245-2222(+)
MAAACGVVQSTNGGRRRRPRRGRRRRTVTFNKAERRRRRRRRPARGMLMLVGRSGEAVEAPRRGAVPHAGVLPGPLQRRDTVVVRAPRRRGDLDRVPRGGHRRDGFLGPPRPLGLKTAVVGCARRRSRRRRGCGRRRGRPRRRRRPRVDDASVVWCSARRRVGRTVGRLRRGPPRCVRRPRNLGARALRTAVSRGERRRDGGRGLRTRPAEVRVLLAGAGHGRRGHDDDGHGDVGWRRAARSRGVGRREGGEALVVEPRARVRGAPRRRRRRRRRSRDECRGRRRRRRVRTRPAPPPPAAAILLVTTEEVHCALCAFFVGRVGVH